MGGRKRETYSLIVSPKLVVTRISKVIGTAVVVVGVQDGVVAAATHTHIYIYISANFLANSSFP